MWINLTVELVLEAPSSKLLPMIKLPRTSNILACSRALYFGFLLLHMRISVFFPFYEGAGEGKLEHG